MVMSAKHRPILLLALLVLGKFWPPLAASAQSVYENYTFITLAGVPDNPGWFDGTGDAARFNNPFGVAVDATGNWYVADTYNHTIRKVTPAGVVTTLAG